MCVSLPWPQPRSCPLLPCLQDVDKAWSRVIELGPDNAAAWSNRGTLRLQNQQWAAAYDDLQRAVALEQQRSGSASAVVLNNLGNVEGALGRWGDAMQHYQAAAEDGEMASIAGANYALAAFETGQDDLAVKAARSLLRRWVTRASGGLNTAQERVLGAWYRDILAVMLCWCGSAEAGDPAPASQAVCCMPLRLGMLAAVVLLSLTLPRRDS